jgi:hypothetical protein
MHNEKKKQYNLSACNVGITNGRELWSILLGWPQHETHMKLYDDWSSHSSIIKVTYISNLRGYDVGTTDGRDLWSMPWKSLRMLQVTSFKVVPLGIYTVLYVFQSHLEASLKIIFQSPFSCSLISFWISPMDGKYIPFSEHFNLGKSKNCMEQDME